MATAEPVDLRSTPAERTEPRAEAHAGDSTAADAGAGTGEASPSRFAGFKQRVEQLRVSARSINWDERQLMIIGGVLAPIGVALVLLGWFGASRTPNIYEQIPYMISGGMVGLALVFLGSIFYFAHWLTQMVKENRTHSADLLAALERLDQRMAIDTATTAAAANGGGDHAAPVAVVNGSEPVELVATAKGSMVHRAECVVVAGKTRAGLRRVTPAEGLAACKLCDPYATDGALPGGARPAADTRGAP